jgi:hypothetical protein
MGSGPVGLVDCGAWSGSGFKSKVDRHFMPLCVADRCRCQRQRFGFAGSRCNTHRTKGSGMRRNCGRCLVLKESGGVEQLHHYVNEAI